MLRQERLYIEKREAISRTVEKKKRELDFLKNLTPDDVIYFSRKKQVYAARLIWRAWRRMKLRTLLHRGNRERFREIRAAITIQRYLRLRIRRKFLEKYRQKDSRRKDHFFHPLTMDQMGDFNKEIEFRAKRFMESDKGKKTDDEIESEYIVSYRNFYDNII